MDIKAYIASGILEAYVLGDLSPQEEGAVEAMLNEHPELQSELAAIERDFEGLAKMTGVEPSLSYDELVQGLTIESQIAPPVKGTRAEAKIVSFDEEKYKRSLRTYKLTAIAASMLALVASIAALNFYSTAKEKDSALVALQSERQQYAENYNMVKDQLDGIQTDLEIIENPSNQRITLAGTEGAPDALAYAYWNTDKEDLYLSIQNLKALAENQQYQLWAIIDGKPVDAGVFDWNSDGLVKMKSFGEGVELFAVTIEPRGGSEGPSLETMQVAGAPGNKS